MEGKILKPARVCGTPSSTLKFYLIWCYKFGTSLRLSSKLRGTPRRAVALIFRKISILGRFEIDEFGSLAEGEGYGYGRAEAPSPAGEAGTDDARHRNRQRADCPKARKRRVPGSNQPPFRFRNQRRHSEHLSPVLPGCHLSVRSSGNSLVVWRQP